MGLDHRVPTPGIFSSSRCHWFPLIPRLALPEPDTLSRRRRLTLPLLTVLHVLRQSSALLMPKFSPKGASISCYYQQLLKLYLRSLRAFIQLTPHKRQPLVLTLKLMSSSHASSLRFLPVSCAQVPACLPRAYLTYYTRPAHRASQWHKGAQV